MNVPPPYPPEPTVEPQPHVPNYLVWAIVITVVAFCLCCVIGAIPGIVAIVFASQVNSKLSQGDIAGARRASDAARLWCWVTTGLAILGLVLNIWWLASGMSEHMMEWAQQMEAQQGR